MQTKIHNSCSNECRDLNFGTSSSHGTLLGSKGTPIFFRLMTILGSYNSGKSLESYTRGLAH